MPFGDLPVQIAAAIVDLLPRRTEELVRQALEQGLPPRVVLIEGLAAGMKRVGELFAAKEYYVPEVLLASRAMYAGFDLVHPLLAAGSLPAPGKVVLGVVAGDIHDIGKNIVKVLLQADGFEVIDVGREVPVEEFVAAVRREQPQLLGMSALMTTTMPEMGAVIRRLSEDGLRTGVKVMVGGAPLTADFARSIGADGYAADAPSAVLEARKLLGHSGG